MKNSASCLTVSETQSFILDFYKACEDMSEVTFQMLFVNYDLSYMEDYEMGKMEMIRVIKSINDLKSERTILQINPFETNCILCYIGKKVQGFEISYVNNAKSSSGNKDIYALNIAFYLEIRSQRLTDFSLCNAFLTPEDLDKI